MLEHKIYLPVVLSDLTHIQSIRQEMPATTAHIYLNTGTFGPLPACAIQAMQERIQAEWRDGRLGAAFFESLANIYKNARSSVAHLLNADADEISLTDNTGEGLNVISHGFNWHEGDEVITTNHEHFSALAPLYQLRDRYGIVIRFADIGPKGDAPILKTYVGYWSAKHEEGTEWELEDSAKRFELGGRQTAAVAGQCAVLQWLEETVGYQWMFERILTLSAYAYHALKVLPDVTILTPRPGESGLVSFLLDGHDVKEVVTQLRDLHNIYIRDIPSTRSLRISTGFYNTEEEIDILAQALREI